MIPCRFISLISLLCLLFQQAQEALCQGREIKAKGEYTYILPETESEAYGCEIALMRAKLSAIEANFGTVISMQNITEIDSRNAHSSVAFTSRGLSEVKGEWIKNLAEPEISVERSGGATVITCAVYGIIREITSAPVEFSAKLLCNGTAAKFQRTDFQNNDDLYLSFQSPTDGYVAVYLRDEKRNAFRLLPYPQSNAGPQHVEGGVKYVFFSHDTAPPHLQGVTTAYHLTAESSLEHNYVYIIFSPQHFGIANDTDAGEDGLRGLSFGEYEEWIGNLRRKDYSVQVMEIPITISR